MAKFKTRARTIDLLGRQQIADAATAISELFKNSHDAYADHVEIDYFRSDDLLVIRDDGIGMTREEFENRWLVIGTESKTNTADHSAKFQPKGKEKRAVMGEKGIGRLAIALLGSQVLVLTKAKRNDELSDLTMCFINWRLFEIPSLNLDDIDFPIQSISHGSIPTQGQVNELVVISTDSVKALEAKYPQSDFSKILEEMDNFIVDPVDLDDFLGGLSLQEDGGTHFIITPANDEIRSEIEREQSSKTKEFSKSLLGFCNATFCSVQPPPMQTALRYWPSDVAFEELVGSGEFFTQEDVASGDQHITGEINEYGQFIGDVRVYEKTYEKHVISWKAGGGKKRYAAL